MILETCLQLLLCIFSIGITYGTLNNRIKQVESTLEDHKNIGERLARIEERLNLLNICSKIIFNSEWSKKQYLKDLKSFFHKSKKLEVIHQMETTQLIKEIQLLWI